MDLAAAARLLHSACVMPAHDACCCEVRASTCCRCSGRRRLLLISSIQSVLPSAAAHHVADRVAAAAIISKLDKRDAARPPAVVSGNSGVANEMVASLSLLWAAQVG